MNAPQYRLVPVQERTTVCVSSGPHALACSAELSTGAMRGYGYQHGHRAFKKDNALASVTTLSAGTIKKEKGLPSGTNGSPITTASSRGLVIRLTVSRAANVQQSCTDKFPAEPIPIFNVQRLCFLELLQQGCSRGVSWPSRTRFSTRVRCLSTCILPSAICRSALRQMLHQDFPFHAHLKNKDRGDE